MTAADVVREKVAVLVDRADEARLTAQLAVSRETMQKYCALANRFDALVREAKTVLAQSEGEPSSS